MAKGFRRGATNRGYPDTLHSREDFMQWVFAHTGNHLHELPTLHPSLAGRDGVKRVIHWDGVWLVLVNDRKESSWWAKTCLDRVTWETAPEWAGF